MFTRSRFHSALTTLVAAFLATACGSAIAGEREELPATTELTVRLTETLNSDRHGAGHEFTAEVRDAVRSEGKVVIPAGAPVRGRILDFGDDPPRLELEFDVVEVYGETYPLHAGLVAVTPREHSEMKDEGAKIGGGAAAGAVLGAVIGGGVREAVIGAAAGAAAGTGVAILTKDRHAFLPRGSTMRLRLLEPLEIVVPEEPEATSNETGSDESGSM